MTKKYEYPEIIFKATNVDAQMMWMTKNPEDYGVIVSGKSVRRYYL